MLPSNLELLAIESIDGKKVVNITGDDLILCDSTGRPDKIALPADYTVACLPTWVEWREQVDDLTIVTHRERAVDHVEGLPAEKPGIALVVPDQHIAICAIAAEPERQDIYYPDGEIYDADTDTICYKRVIHANFDSCRFA